MKTGSKGTNVRSKVLTNWGEEQVAGKVRRLGLWVPLRWGRGTVWGPVCTPAVENRHGSSGPQVKDKECLSLAATMKHPR